MCKRRNNNERPKYQTFAFDQIIVLFCWESLAAWGEAGAAGNDHYYSTRVLRRPPGSSFSAWLTFGALSDVKVPRSFLCESCDSGGLSDKFLELRDLREVDLRSSQRGCYKNAAGK